MLTAESRNVALGIVIFCLVLSLLLDAPSLVITGVILLVGIILDLRFVASLADTWHSLFTKVITYVSNALLGFIYILFITPYSAIYRFFNSSKITIFLKGPQNPGGYHLINKMYSKDDLQNPW